MRSTLTIAVLGACALCAHAADAQQAVPVRDLSAAVTRSPESFGAILGVRQIAGSKVLVNDATRRQLIMLDSSLAHRSVVIDSTAGSANSYGAFGAPLIPYLGDSTLFVDASSLSLLVIDPLGKVSHVMSSPRPSDLMFLRNSAAGVDNKGRLLYRGVQRVTQQRPADGGRGAPGAPGAPGAGGGLNIPQPPDSAPILRADFDSRQVDTVGRVKVPSGSRLNMTPSTDGKPPKIKSTVNPLTSTDDWAVLSDGSIAFVRGHDYHVDMIHPDGSVLSSPKLPFDWKRLTDDDKQHLIDSARTAMDAAQAKAAEDAKTKGGSSANEMMAMGEVMAMKGAMAAGSGGGGTMVVVRGDGAGAAAGGGGAPMVFGGPGGGLNIETEFVPLSEIADYYPAIRPGAAKADMDGNLWVLPTTSAQSKAGELVYDVINNMGVLTQRVRIPLGRSIAGFGRGGVVYLQSGNRADGFFLERARVIDGKRVTQ